jgi:hypothetical protein
LAQEQEPGERGRAAGGDRGLEPMSAPRRAQGI